MAIGDWFLARSEAFRYLLSKFSEHKSETMKSFNKVKNENKIIIKKIKDHDDAINNFGRIIKELRSKGIVLEESTSRIIKRKR
ncbi:hypothetical protein HY498_00385 [Candidatus Woesearchaeota archaeon]|nr:hypothetical protein [Candidatus Woesearchaeota archaeon]